MMAGRGIMQASLAATGCIVLIAITGCAGDVKSDALSNRKEEVTKARSDCDLSVPKSWKPAPSAGCGEEVRLTEADMQSVGEGWREDSGRVNDPPLDARIFNMHNCEAMAVGNVKAIGAQVSELQKSEGHPEASVSAGSTIDEWSVWQDVLVLEDAKSARRLAESRIALWRSAMSCVGTSDSLHDAFEYLGADSDAYWRPDRTDSEVEGAGIEGADAVFLRDREEGSGRASRPVAILHRGPYYAELRLSGVPDWDARIVALAVSKMERPDGD